MLARSLLLKSGAGHNRSHYCHTIPLLCILADVNRLGGESFGLLLKCGDVTAHFH